MDREWVAGYRKLALALAAPHARRWPYLADDLRGAALLGLVEAAATYRGGPVPFAAFARRRILGAIRDVLRAEARQATRRHRGVSPEPLDPHDDTAAPDRADAFAALPEGEILRRVYRDGQTQAEIGAALGYSQTRIGTRKDEALALLRLRGAARVRATLGE